MKYLIIVTVICGLIDNFVFGSFHQDPIENFEFLKTDLLNVVEEKWIKQNLNHFDPQDTRTWQMRYFENLEFFKVGGPVFVYVGGEWEIDKRRLLGGHFFDMAQDFNASLFYTEHRYYGKSRPTEDTSTENLKYLTTDQALADLAHFVTVIKRTTPGLKNSKVFLIGGSYAGTVVTWFRQKYPHLADAVWSSSAPLLATLDFGTFNEVMTQSLEKVADKECFNVFRSAFERMENIISSGNFTKIERNFNLCQPLEAPNDIPHFFYEVTDHIAAFVQSYQPAKMKAACRFLQNKAFPDSVIALGLWVNGLSKNCLDMSYKNAVKKYTQTSWKAEANRQMRQWIYQSCSQLGWFETTSSKNQIFGNRVPKEYFIQLCNDFYDGIFNKTVMERNYEATNEKYGGLNPGITNIYFTHGKLDPWKPVGILHDLGENAQATVIPLASHVADFGQISSNDTIGLSYSKKKVRELVIKWLNL